MISLPARIGGEAYGIETRELSKDFGMHRVIADLDLTVPRGAFYLGSLLGLCGIVWGLVIWRGEGPDRRDYMLAHPAAATMHELSRIIAGAIWLLLGVAVFAVIGALGPITRAQAIGTIAPGALTWILLFSGSLLGYLIVVPIATASTRVFRYLVFGLIAYSVVGTIFVLIGFRLAPGSLGLLWALAGPTFDYGILRIHVQDLRFFTWAAATAVWYCIAVAIIALTLRRRARRFG